MGTVGGVAAQEIEKNACTAAYVDDHDDDRSISAFISVSFHSSHHPFMPTSTDG
jgi:hypothetical protein